LLLHRWVPGATTTPSFYHFNFLTSFSLPYSIHFIFSARGVNPLLQNYHSTNLPCGWLGHRNVIKSRFAGLSALVF
jgi:hypothetical protein